MKTDPARTFRDLIVWRKAHEFVLWVYRFTTNFPKDERFGLTSQLGGPPYLCRRMSPRDSRNEAAAIEPDS
jgi:hypothetical protein